MTLADAVRIHADLAPHVVPIDAVQPHPENVRQGNVEAIAASLSKYGQTKPIVAQDGSGYIVAGNHTWEAAKRLGWPDIAVVYVDLDDRAALGYLLADNHTSDLGTYHRKRLADTLSRLADNGWLADSLWSADELDDLWAETEAAITPVEEFRGTYALTDEQIERFKAAASKPKEEVGARRFREVPLLIREDEHRAFIENVTALEKAYGTSGKVATIVEAVRREAERLGG